MYDGDSLECGHYVSDVFDANTVIWWHCDGDDISKIRDFAEGIYTREAQKIYYEQGRNFWLRKNLAGCLYQNK